MTFAHMFVRNKNLMQKMLLSSLFLAVMLTTTLAGMNCAILGVNPFSLYGKWKRQAKEKTDFWDNLSAVDADVIPGLPPGTRYRDLPEDL